MPRTKSTPVAETVTIKASSRASIKVGDNFYTVEWTEERTVAPGSDIKAERERLWSDVNNEVDMQIADILEAYGNKRRK